MAITGDVSHGLIFLRPFVVQQISAAGWKALFEQKSSRNFDGEIMVFGYLSYPALQNTLSNLKSYGYFGPKDMFGDYGKTSWGKRKSGHDFDIFCETYQNERRPLKHPAWVESVEVTFFDDARPSVQAWKMKDSEVYDLLDHRTGTYIGRKGEDCDWHPHIGKRGRDWH